MLMRVVLVRVLEMMMILQAQRNDVSDLRLRLQSPAP